MIKKYLLAPGPTPVPESVLLAMAQPIFHHRTPQFEALFADTAKSLRALFKTGQDVVILASSGTGAMEAAVTNTTSPGDRVLVVNGGKFGERWGKIAVGCGLVVTEIKVEWGTAVDPAAIAKALQAHPETKLVLMQGSETSTTVLHPVAEVAKITRETDALLVVDGITAVGVLDLPMDALGIDVLLTGSQKALMLPPGLAFVALSEKAWKAVAASKQPRFYFDLKRERDNQQKHTTAWTPAISLIFGLHEALRLMFAEGLDNVFARHDRLARATRAGAEALGLKLVAPTAPSPATTGIFLPEGVPGKLVGYLRDQVGITFAGGQDQLKGKICRVAHLGYIGSFDIVTALAALEMGMAAFGRPVELGKGVGAAQKILMEGMPATPAA
ncbi:MAG: alanine--glyoxylate aminotransferase family protein [Deltaproteobacteria bacterium]|nr:alanine--glyoxylate aminotransferase family protein [Deltaproteobacteria bacterium]